MERLEIVISQYKKMNKEADDIENLKRKMYQLKANLELNWSGRETRALFAAIDETTYKLRRLNNEIVDFAHDYLKYAQLDET